MKKLILLPLLLCSTLSFATSPQKAIISIAAEDFEVVQEHLSFLSDIEKSRTESEVFLEVPESAIGSISVLMHDKYNRCGGFFHFTSEEQAEDWMSLQFNDSLATRSNFLAYTIDQEAIVEPLLPLMSSRKIT